MKSDVRIFKTIAVLFALFVAIGSYAQSPSEIGEMFKTALETKDGGDVEGAIAQLEECLEVAIEYNDEYEDEQVGSIIDQIEENIPKLYMTLSTSKLKAKDYTGGLKSAYKTKEIAEGYGDAETAKKATAMITQVHYKMGASKFKAQDFDAAIAQFDKALAANPDYVKAAYLKTVCFSKKGDDENLKASANNTNAIAEKTNNPAEAAKVNKLAANYFLKKGNEAKGANNYDEAIANLKSSLEFGENNTTTMYLLADVYKAKGDHAAAIETAQKALEVETGGAEAVAKLNFLIGEAQQAKGDNAAACAAYKLVTVGPYAENAKYKVETELNCQ